MIKGIKIRYRIIKPFVFCAAILVHSFGNTQISNPNSINIISQPHNQFAQNKLKPIPNHQTNNTNNSVQMGVHGNNLIKQQEAQAMQKMGYNPPVIPTQNNPFPQQKGKYYQSTEQESINEIRKILEEVNKDQITTTNIKQVDASNKTAVSYKAVYDEIMKMYRNEIPFSLKRSIFMIENVYSNYSLNYSEYCKLIQNRIDAIKALLKTEKINENNHLGKNYIIQKMFSEKVIINQNNIQKSFLPFGYDFEDYNGKNDWSKMFVDKLLKTGKGQCHSLPLLYLILAEETNTKAWLTLSPEHSFIQFCENNGKTWYNFETTNGNSVTTDWLMESGYISSEAVKNRIYLDTLSKEGLISTLLADLAMGYVEKMGYDDFVHSMVGTIEAIYPKNIQGHLFKADIMTIITQQLVKKYGSPSIETISKFPELDRQFKALTAQYDKIDNLGYIKMPDEIYQAWLASLNEEKQKETKESLKKTIIENAKKNN